MNGFAGGILLDTHAAIWWMDGSLPSASADKLVAAGLKTGVFVSPISAWEIGMLARSTKNGRLPQFLPDPATWFATLMSKSIVKPAPLTNEIAIAVSSLPGPFHPDPADRFLVATARAMSIPLMTRDGKIADYAAQGYLEVVAC